MQKAPPAAGRPTAWVASAMAVDPLTTQNPISSR